MVISIEIGFMLKRFVRRRYEQQNKGFCSPDNVNSNEKYRVQRKQTRQSTKSAKAQLENYHKGAKYSISHFHGQSFIVNSVSASFPRNVSVPGFFVRSSGFWHRQRPGPSPEFGAGAGSTVHKSAPQRCQTCAGLRWCRGGSRRCRDGHILPRSWEGSGACRPGVRQPWQYFMSHFHPTGRKSGTLRGDRPAAILDGTKEEEEASAAGRTEPAKIKHSYFNWKR